MFNQKIRAVVFLALLAVLFPSKAFGAVASHIVISEVQIGGAQTTDDFIELYNPANQPVSLDGYRLVKRTASGTSDSSIKSFSSSDTIPAFGFYLWANSSYSGITSAPDATTSSTIASDNGVALRYGGEDTGVIVDSIAWGSSSNVFVEGSAFATNPAAGKSIERKPGEADSLKGNGEDSDDNSVDFSLRETLEPQNSSSPIEIPEGMSLPENEPPVANCGGDRTIIVGTEASFDGLASSDPDGSIASYSWDLGDDTASSEASFGHTYGSVDTYAVELTVTDDDGDSGSDICQINVIDAPIYSETVFLNEIFPYPNSTYDWDGDGVADSGDEWIELVNVGDESVDLGDWILDDIESGGSSPYTIPVGTFISPDGYLVFYKSETGLTLNNTGDTVILKTPDGLTVDQYSYGSATSEKSISRVSEDSDEWEDGYAPSPDAVNSPPSNQYPVVNAGSNITGAKTGEAVSFNGSSSYDNDGQITSYLWNFGNGATGSGATASYAYSVPGTYQVTLTVKDDDGATSSASINVSVVQGTPENTIYQYQFSDLIKITEIMPNPSGSDSEKEYIKIENFDTKDVNLRGWQLDDAEGGSKPFIIDYDLILKPKTPITFYSLDTKLSLNNSGDECRLIDPNKKAVSFVEYSENAKEDVPLCLVNGTWVWEVEEEALKDQDDSSESESGVVSPKTDSSAKSTVTPKATSENTPAKEETKKVVPSIQVLANSTENKAPVTTAQGGLSENKVVLFDLGAPQKESKKSQSAEPSLGSIKKESEDAPSDSPKSPLAAVPLMGFSFLAISRFFVRPEDWKKVIGKIEQMKKEDDEKFERLFK